MEFKWQPWTDFQSEPESLPIEEPPCRRCKHWLPRRIFSPDGKFEGVRLCHVSFAYPPGSEQEPDFSCFVNREK